MICPRQAIVLCLIAVAAAAELPIPIVSQSADFKEDGSYTHK